MTKARDELQNIKLKDILDQLIVNTGEEYLKLHAEGQDFSLTNGRMNYYENAAIKEILSQVDTYVKGIIGEDEQPQYGSDKYLAYDPNVRNDLRAEQRKRAGLEGE